MDKYYVGDDETILGHDRIQTLLQVSSEIAKAIKTIDYDKYEEGTSNKNESAKVNDSQDAQEERAIKRVWGSWEIINPAAGGTESQVSLHSSHIHIHICL
jgi:hypothetical protein